ncbi:transcription factor bHLH101-like [Chenopodium quinoa]|uniref:transcription factor bHLH101-like n=1 Tax=Chenopodium quinoa TaxID=63459 RepID=UPI000B780DE4|nr:transcription factor bHLH101-like [Chenopodium quinoa]XP_021741135.1 transcription factor bHLH101-like [Chenopodium quinoa]XP_021741137.1 transcription factor bHLH101-like [Chenopodium quinoa]
MLAMSSLCPTNLGWDYPLELETKQPFDNFDLDSIFLANVSSSQTPDYEDNQMSSDQAKRSESPQGTSSTDQFNNNPSISKKLNHNASERDRRKKINNMYSSLRSLLPTNDQRKKLSIPATVERVLEYIPQLQTEVEDLIHKKENLLSKTSILQGNARKTLQEENPNKCIIKNTTSSCSISSNKLGDKELVIQISVFERISISEVLLVLEENGYLVLDVSSFQSFGGTTFYNIHLWIQGNCNINFEKLNEALMFQLQKQQMMQMHVYS